MYEIQKGVPLPSPVKKAKELGPFSATAIALEVGDSFVCDYAGTCAKAQALLQYAQRKFPERKFATRKVDGGIGIWRVA